MRRPRFGVRWRHTVPRDAGLSPNRHGLYNSMVSLCLNLRLARSAERKQNWFPKSSSSILGRSRTVRFPLSADVMSPCVSATLGVVAVDSFEAGTGVEDDVVA